jgi:hypothetical protein
MKQVTIRLDIRVPEDVNEFLLDEAHSKKMSFEGLILIYIQDRMKSEKQRHQHSGPALA